MISGLEETWTITMLSVIFVIKEKKSGERTGNNKKEEKNHWICEEADQLPLEAEGKRRTEMVYKQ